MAAEAIKLSEREHPLYTINLDLWSLFLDAVKGGTSFINSTNVFSHRLEDATDYGSRLDRGYYLNFCKSVPELYNTYIFKEKIERPPDSILVDFRKDVDGVGTPIDKFISRLGFLSSIFGAMHTLVDVPAVGQKKISKAQAKKDKIRPYVELIYPQQLKDWSVDRFGNLRWVVIESVYYKDEDYKVEREEELHYKLITTEEWKIEDEDGNPVKFEDGSPNKGKNTLGIVPFCTLYHQDIDDDLVGESMLSDIVYINRIILNWCSCIDEQIERNTFSQLIVPDDGTLAEESETGDDPLYRVGNTSIFTFPANAGQPPQFISPNVECINVIWNLVTDHIKEIYRLAGLIGSSEDMYASRSGRSAQMGFMSVNSALTNKAKQYERIENEINKLAYLQYGKDFSKIEPVKYPNSFDISSLEEEINNSFKIMEKNFSVTLNKQMQKDISRRAIPLASQEVRTQVESEIESGTGIVEAKSGAEEKEKKPFDDGSGRELKVDTFKTNKEKEDEEIKKEKKE